MSSPVEKVVSRLDKCIQTKPNQWQAICPAHDDKSPSLSIKEQSDGTVLINCFAGCDSLNIVEAIGLELKDLFPPSEDYPLVQRHRGRTSSQQKTVDEWFVELVEADLAAGKPIPEKDKQKYIRLKTGSMR